MIVVSIVVAGTMGYQNAKAAEKESITLQNLIALTTTGHPLVRGAQSEVTAGKFDVDAARRHWLPNMSATLETDTGTTSSGSSRALQVEQTLWDGGQLNAGIAQARAGLSKSEARVILQRQQLALQVVAAWQTLMSSRDRIDVAEKTMDKLHAYEAQMRRRVAADASPAIDLELVLSRIRQNEVDLSTARTSLRVAAQRLEQLSGTPNLDGHVRDLPAWPNPQIVRQVSEPVISADLDAAARDSIVVRVAQGDADIVTAQLDAKRAERWPTAYVRVSKPFGGPTPSQPVVDNRPAIFFGVRYTPGAGFATGTEADALAARLAAVDQSVEATFREQRETMRGDREEFTSSLGRLQALDGAVDGSQQVLDSYSRQFTAGRKTWIDLLNAVRELSQNQFAQVESQAAMTAALYRLQLRQGRDQLLP